MVERKATRLARAILGDERRPDGRGWDKLSLDDLRRLRRIACEPGLDAAIAARAAEPRRGVWIVHGYMGPVSAFPEANYLEAARALADYAQTLATTERKLHRRELALTYSLLPASECAALGL